MLKEEGNKKSSQTGIIFPSNFIFIFGCYTSNIPIWTKSRNYDTIMLPEIGNK